MLNSITFLEIFAALSGGTNVLGFYTFFKNRKAESKKVEASALESMQNVYDKFVLQAELRFEQMQKTIDNQQREIDKLKENLKTQIAKCRNCHE